MCSFPFIYIPSLIIFTTVQRCTVSVVMAMPADSCEFIPSSCSLPVHLYCTCTLCSPVQYCTAHVHCVHLYNTVLYVYVRCVHLYNTVLYMYVVFTCTILYCTCTLCSPVQHCTVHVHCVHLYKTVLYVQMYHSCTKGEK